MYRDLGRFSKEKFDSFYVTAAHFEELYLIRLPRQSSCCDHENKQAEIYVIEIGNIQNLLVRHKHTSSPGSISNGETHKKLTVTDTESAVSFTSRTHTCGSLRPKDIDKHVRLSGWIQSVHFKGKFVQLRDWDGWVQLVITDDKTDMLDKISSLRLESVIEVTGTVKHREQVNENTPTGLIEVIVDSLHVLNTVDDDLPFMQKELNFHKVNEQLQMEYRYLALRYKTLQHNLRQRSKIIMKMREYLANNHNFVDVETPTLFRRTPGGAKEFVVPTCLPGKFYSLPQSPQQFKQLLMVGGIDRYFQVAKCYRDEGARPDRQPEFTQLDIEMSFVTREGIIKLIEELLVHCWPDDKSPLQLPFPTMTYKQAMRLYGTDKPDTRFDMKAADDRPPGTVCSNFHWSSSLSTVPPDLSGQLELNVLLNVSIFIQGENYKLISGFPQHYIALFQINSLEDKELGNIGSETMGIKFKDMTKHISKSKLNSHLKSLHYKPKAKWQIHRFSDAGSYSDEVQRRIQSEWNCGIHDVVVTATGEEKDCCELLGLLRPFIADELESKGEQVRDPNKFNFLWVLDFPLFLPKEQGEGLESAHHPFTDVHPDDAHLFYTHPEQVRGQHYDLVLNGNEVGGGSIRIHNPDKQKYVIEQVLKEDVQELSHLLKAFTMGCPPHGGIALGLDRLLACILGTNSIRDVIAFPKSTAGRDLMSDAPAEISPEELDRYHIAVIKDR